VTEAVFGIDLVEWMIRQAAGEDVLSLASAQTVRRGDRGPRLRGNAACRLPPERRIADRSRLSKQRPRRWLDRDRNRGHAILRPDARQDYRRSRQQAGGDRKAAGGAGADLDIGHRDQSRLSQAIAGSELLASGKVATTALRDFAFVPDIIEVFAPGAQSSLQELPGRLGLWHVGVPPSGPMDERSFRHAKPAGRQCRYDGGAGADRLRPDIALLQGYHHRPCWRLHGHELQRQDVAHGEAVLIRAGEVLSIGAIEGAGQRAYLAVAGGLAAPVVLGSRATFGLGQFGGHATGTLKTGHVLRLARQMPATPQNPQPSRRN
jgi:urea carboxylase